MGMEIQQLRAFVAVVDTASFTKAADRIALSQPAVSVAIAKLEDELSVRLFDRRPGMVALTVAGEHLLVTARAVLDACGKVKADFKSWSARHVLRVGILRTLPTQPVASLIESFSAAHPEVLLRLQDGSSTQLDTWFDEGSLDACLTDVTLHQGEADCVAVFEEAYVLVVGKQHRLAHRSSVRLDELHGEPFIQRTHCMTFTATNDLLRDRAIEPKVVYSTDQDDRALGLIASGIGVAVMPETFDAVGVRKVRVTDLNTSRVVGLRMRSVAEDEWLSLFAGYARTHRWKAAPGG
jgi:DNA-binding transcriptional LysR family regulator